MFCAVIPSGPPLGARRVMIPPLLNARTSALDENDQNDQKQRSGKYPNDGCSIHKAPILLLPY